jgi:hypothetical protein
LATRKDGVADHFRMECQCSDVIEEAPDADGKRAVLRDDSRGVVERVGRCDAVAV